MQSRRYSHTRRLPTSKKQEEKKALKKATLSVTAKAKARSAKKEAKSEGGKDASMDIDKPADAAQTPKKKDGDGDVQMGDNKDKDKKPDSALKIEIKDGDNKDKDKDDKDKDKEKEKEKEKEPDFQVLTNPARVTVAQQPLISYDKNQRYIPVKKRLWGVVMLKDMKSTESEELVVTSAPKVGIPGIGDDEPEPPEPFEYTRN